MNVINQALQAASMKSWPVQQEADNELKLEIPTDAGRTQVVNINSGTDNDGDAVAFIWSKAGELSNPAFDPWQLLRLNTQLSYGRVAVRGDDVVVVHALLDSDAQLAETGKTLYWVARAADDIERGAYGDYQDVL